MKSETLYLIALALIGSCNETRTFNGTAYLPQELAPDQTPESAGLSVAHFAEGCFWCSEEIFQSVKGVKRVVNGYAGGTLENPTYEQVSTGTTGHAESVEVYYDPGQVSYETLLKVFFASQDPTTPSRQGPDAGSQYRSVAFYDTPRQQQQIKAYIRSLEASGKYGAPIVTEVLPFGTFWPAEEEHQDYARQHPNDPYVKNVSLPRFERFRNEMPDVVKGSTE